MNHVRAIRDLIRVKFAYPRRFKMSQAYALAEMHWLTWEHEYKNLESFRGAIRKMVSTYEVRDMGLLIQPKGFHQYPPPNEETTTMSALSQLGFRRQEPLSLIEEITPLRAKEYLASSKGNRKLREKKLDEYVGSMRSGHWQVNGETIAFDEDGALRNGHHRLTACIRAGASFKSWVVRGVPRDSRFDDGAKRENGDELSVEGCVSAKTTAAAARWVWNIRRGTALSLIAIPRHDLLALWREAPGAFHGAALAASRCRKFLQPAIGAALYFLFQEIDADAAGKFFDDLATGGGMADDDPVYVLREGLLRSRLDKRSQMRVQEIGARIVRAWNLRRRGVMARQIKGLVKNENGTASFPEIE